jgi:hypothetical protein
MDDRKNHVGWWYVEKNQMEGKVEDGSKIEDSFLKWGTPSVSDLGIFAYKL